MQRVIECCASAFFTFDPIDTASRDSLTNHTTQKVKSKGPGLFLLHATPSACTGRLPSHGNLGFMARTFTGTRRGSARRKFTLYLLLWMKNLMEAVRFVVIHSFAYVRC
jgi:hypothetical protein